MVKLALLAALAACGHIGFDPVPREPGQCAVTISGLGNPACALRNDGRVVCWGENSSGELGDGTKEARVDPVLAEGIDEAIGIGTGEDHACAITGDATAMCWGENSSGQVGDGTVSPRLTPTPVYQLGDVVQIATGQSHTCARHSDGQVSCWGGSSAGATGTLGPNLLTPARVAGVSGATHLAVGDNITCVLIGDRAQCWGDDVLLGDGTLVNRATPGPPALPPGRVVDVAVGCHRHACAVMEDGSAWCWGDNTKYQLGDGTKTTSKVPVRVQSSYPFSRVSVGASHSCGLDSEGSVWCWGDNTHFQIDGAAVPATVPRRVPLPEPVVQIETGCATTCARAGGRVWCWGDDELAGTGSQPVHEIAIPCTM